MPEIRNAKSYAPRRVAICAIIFSALALIFSNSDAAIASAKQSLALCAQTVIPSLFPFMVISELIVLSGAARAVGRLIAPVFKALFGINGNGAAALLLGTLCGFPIGARTACAMCKSGELSEEDVGSLLCFCNNPSSAFLINAVGVSLFGSRTLGVMLYSVTVASALLIGIVMGAAKRLLGKARAEHKTVKVKGTVSSETGIHAFTNAIASCASGMLTVCAFVVFFSVLTGTLNAAMSPLDVPPMLKTACVGFFEITGGVASAASSLSGDVGIYMCAAIAGWSGLSVHFQIMSMCKDCNIPFKPYFAAKAAQGMLGVLLLAAYAHIAKPRLCPSVNTEARLSTYAYCTYRPVLLSILALFVISTALLAYKKVKDIRTKRII